MNSLYYSLGQPSFTHDKLDLMVNGRMSEQAMSKYCCVPIISSAWNIILKLLLSWNQVTLPTFRYLIDTPYENIKDANPHYVLFYIWRSGATLEMGFDKKLYYIYI